MRLRTVVRRPDLHRLALCCIVLLFAVRGLLWIGMLPYLQEPDGRSHVANAEHVLDDPGSYVARPTEIKVSESLLATQRALDTYEIQAQPLFRGPVISERASAEAEAELAGVRRGPEAFTPLLSTARSYPPFYYAGAAVLASTAGDLEPLDRGYRMRLFSLLLSLGTLAFCYLTLVEMFGRGRRALLGAATLTLLPMPVFLGTIINPDVAVTMLLAALTWLATRCARRGWIGWRAALGLGVVGTLGLLSKQSFLVGLPVLPALAAYCAYRQRSWRQLLHGLLALVLVAVGAGWFYVVRSGARLGSSKAADDASAAVTTPTEGPMSWGEYLQWLDWTRVDLIRNEFWGVFGWLDTQLPFHLYTYTSLVTSAVLALMLVGAARGIVARRVDGAVLVAGIITCALVLLLLEAEKRGVHRRGVFVQGRYFMIALVPMMVLVMAGVSSAVRNHSLRSVMAIGWLGFAALLQVVGLAQAMIPRYYL